MVTDTEKRTITLAHSPDSDDAFMFYGLATNKLDTGNLQFQHLLKDIQTLNEEATRGTYDVTAISFHAYSYVADKYALLPHGASIGDNYGPIVVARTSMKPEDISKLRIAIPGTLTSAFLALRIFNSEFEYVVVPFDKIIDAVVDGTWWHGGFRTAPYFHNSIGILSEAASARLMTPSTVTVDQLTRSSTRGMRSATEATTNFPDPWPAATWHPRNIMDMELIAARGVLSLAAKYKADYLRNFYQLGRKNVEQAVQPNQPIAYLVPAGLSRGEAVAKLIGSLIDQGVEVFRLDSELHVSYGPQMLQRTNVAIDKLGTYRTIVANTTAMQEVPAGSYIVFVSQPQRTNVLALFEPQIYPNRLTGTGEAERPYDVAGWTLPLQLGVAAPAVLSIRETAADRKLTLLKEENEVRADLALPLRKSEESPIKNPIPQPVRIGIYKGSTGNMPACWQCSELSLVLILNRTSFWLMLEKSRTAQRPNEESFEEMPSPLASQQPRSLQRLLVTHICSN